MRLKALSVRDLAFWAREARRRQITRQMELYNAAVLALMSDADVRQEFERIKFEAIELDHGHEVDSSAERYLARVKAGTHRPKKRMKKKKKRVIKEASDGV